MDIDSPRPPRSPSPVAASASQLARATTPRSERDSADTLRADAERTPGPGRAVLDTAGTSPQPSHPGEQQQQQHASSQESPSLPSTQFSSTQQSSSSASTWTSNTSTSPMNGIHDSDADDTEHNDGTSCSSSGASIGPASHTSNGAPAEVQVAGADGCPDDMDRFLRRVEMEKKIAQLQQRLELASIKTNHGWTDMSINEIETRLPSQPPSRRPQVLVPNGNGPAYEPPSPARPWQLADVLWHPLPQPGSRGAYPSRPRGPHPSHHGPSHSLPALPSLASLHGPGMRGPSSPRRQRMDDILARPTLSPLRSGHSHVSGHHHSNSQHAPGSRLSNGGGHRRASSSISSLQFLSNDPYPVSASPLRPTASSSSASSSKKPPKKRSQSHSNLRDRPTTQDVDAARALAFMFGSGRSPTTPTQDRMGPPDAPGLAAPPTFSGGPPGPGPILPPPHSGASLPSPFSPEQMPMPPPRQRAQSFVVPDRDANGVFTRPHLPPPPPLRRPNHTRNRGQSMDSSAAFRTSFWRHSPEKDRERERERDREQREHDDMRERDFERDRARRTGGSGGPEEDLGNRGEDDKTAVELMMFLAHSPSPVRKRTNSEVRPTFGSTARVLFADDEPRSGPGSMGPPLSVRRDTHPLGARN